MHRYYFNYKLPKSWIQLKISLLDTYHYKLLISIHHYGYDDSTIAIGSFLETDFDSKKTSKNEDVIDYKTKPLELPPHVISIVNNNEIKINNIRHYIQEIFTVALGQISNEIGHGL